MEIQVVCNLWVLKHSPPPPHHHPPPPVTYFDLGLLKLFGLQNQTRKIVKIYKDFEL